MPREETLNSDQGGELTPAIGCGKSRSGIGARGHRDDAAGFTPSGSYNHAASWRCGTMLPVNNDLTPDREARAIRHSTPTAPHITHDASRAPAHSAGQRPASPPGHRGMSRGMRRPGGRTPSAILPSNASRVSPKAWRRLVDCPHWLPRQPSPNTWNRNDRHGRSQADRAFRLHMPALATRGSTVRLHVLQGPASGPTRARSWGAQPVDFAGRGPLGRCPSYAESASGSVRARLTSSLFSAWR